MKSGRRTSEHEFEARSRDQLKDFLHALGWVVESFTQDYGEDLYTRIFEQGNPTGHDFYIQLKGTDNVEQYALKNKPVFSYSVDLVNIKQWYSFTLPVILVLWDINQRIGYWIYLQPIIRNKLQTNANWLENSTGAKEPKRKVYIPRSQILHNQKADLLKQVIDAEYSKTKLGKKYFERLHKEHLKEFKHNLEKNPEIINIPQQPSPLPSQVEQQFLITQYTADVTANPLDVEAWLELAHIYYNLDEKDKALMAINKAWELNKDDPGIINARACTLAEYAIAYGGPKSLLHEAIELFESLRGDMAASIVDYNIGNSFAGLGEHEKAIKHFDQALAANPNPQQAAQIWKTRGSSFYELGNRNEEVKSFEQALELNPQLWQAYASWAASEVREENFKKAIELYTKAFQANPDLETIGYDLLYWLAYSLDIISIR